MVLGSVVLDTRGKETIPALDDEFGDGITCKTDYSEDLDTHLRAWVGWEHLRRSDESA